jgi:hypothetical protein
MKRNKMIKFSLPILIFITTLKQNAVLFDPHPTSVPQMKQRFVLKYPSKEDTTKRKHIFHLKKGSHFSNPRGLLSRRLTLLDSLKWQCRLDSSCRYIMLLKNGKLHEDQWDYNKLTGITFTPYYPQGNTAMVGWRYNPKTTVFELVPYWHLDYKRIFNEKPFVSVTIDELFTVEMITNFNKKQVTTVIKTLKGQLSDTKAFHRIPKRASLIHPYFGGTSLAPKEMFVYCKRVK